MLWAHVAPEQFLPLEYAVELGLFWMAKGCVVRQKWMLVGSVVALGSFLTLKGNAATPWYRSLEFAVRRGNWTTAVSRLNETRLVFHFLCLCS